MTMRGLLSREPVRVYLYGVVVAVASALAGFGVVSERNLPMILGVCAAVLAVPVVEKARAKVSPVAVARAPEVASGDDAEAAAAEVYAEEQADADAALEDELDAAILDDSEVDPEPKG